MLEPLSLWFPVVFEEVQFAQILFIVAYSSNYMCIIFGFYDNFFYEF